ncbi:hypothetical protein C7I87_02040 [Mesorhizobium sp. SARCC-RB16n]|uniref:IS66 family transposase n=1 Tax=Mesorhizobium sp. SARCC-RB16n TaxID=2116687 RepID=UPI00122EDCE3|nr:hypothetical protein [Mesorhizobium sp. SARCC-RB16n]KAA3452209.1 hypothetical protein C7I87_02040 [Mesorhizobium sp. SARCC-RB16n]
MKFIIKQLQRQFGRRSKQLDPDQALALEELDADIAREEERGPRVGRQQHNLPSDHKPLPDHLPRENVRLDIDDTTCKGCGRVLHLIGAMRPAIV